ncbi:hypothetical protein [Sporomusa termitida]|uniref:Uncharacterized protein n=1 Tax=Sporomusa termitida TaxID=2377 RepID=A0A517DQB2_9FIRM|nr:hypothetical protein [Sporomusa termitida]QDR79549.1 hypothetical protein SPTER_08240 [Sporomusa termitida]
MSDEITGSGSAACPRPTSVLPAAPDREPQQTGAEQEDRLMLQSILNEAFNQYIFTRVDNILKLAGTNDAGYSKTVSKVGAILDRLLALAGELESQYPELLELVWISSRSQPWNPASRRKSPTSRACGTAAIFTRNLWPFCSSGRIGGQWRLISPIKHPKCPQRANESIFSLITSYLRLERRVLLAFVYSP